MRILYIVPYAPSPIRVRPYQLIRSLAARGHSLTVATLWSSKDELESLRNLAGDNVSLIARRLPRWRSTWNCIRSLPTRMPLQAAYCWEPGLLDEVKRALGESPFDVVHIEHLRGSLFGLKVRALLSPEGGSTSANSGTPVIWDSVDCISHLFQQASDQSKSLKGRWMTRLELSRTRRFEGWLTTQFDHTLVSSSTDRDALLGLAPPRSEDDNRNGSASSKGSNVSVLPNGVDFDYFKPDQGPRDSATLVFTGKMSYHANITAAKHLIRDIMPKVWSHRPDVRVVIAGKNPPRSLLALAALQNRSRPAKTNGSESSAGPAVEVTGTIPDIRPYLRRATIAVAPIPYGAGIQNKVLEAMACGVPVITSPRATEALSVQEGRDLLVAGDAESFAAEVLGLLGDRELGESIGKAGRIYVVSNHDWRRIGANLEEIYRQVLRVKNGFPDPDPAAPPVMERAGA